MVLQLGLIVAGLGVFLLAVPAVASVAFARIVGAYVVLLGIGLLLSLIANRRRWGYKLVGGLVGIGAGVFIAEHQRLSGHLVPATVAVLLGVQAVIVGLILLAMGAEDRSFGQVTLGLLTGAVGLVLLFNRWLTAVPLPCALGVACICGGVLAALLAFRAR